MGVSHHKQTDRELCLVSSFSFSFSGFVWFKTDPHEKTLRIENYKYLSRNPLDHCIDIRLLECTHCGSLNLTQDTNEINVHQRPLYT